MAYPKGRPRGPMSEDHKAKLSASISVGQRRSWANPNHRRNRVIGLRKSYENGALAHLKVTWTPEMDNELRCLLSALPWQEARLIAAKRIGVGDKVVVTR